MFFDLLTPANMDNIIHKLKLYLAIAFAFFWIFILESILYNHMVNAKELTFGEGITVEQVTVQPSKPATWYKPNEEEYKTGRLAAYQEMLRKRGITDEGHLRLLTAQLLVEAGSLNESVNGDNGCSVGIPMRNVCLYGYTAKSFRKKYPEWNSLEFQLNWMADQVAAKYEKYDSDIRKIILSHNCPSCAARNVDACHITPCYYQRVVNMSSKLVTL